jgi:hypothetical protein
LVGGASDSSALVAFKVGGYAGQRAVAVRYVHTKSGWTKVGEGDVGYPNNLNELEEMSRLAIESGSSKPR